jgi:hypothetical protein
MEQVANLYIIIFVHKMKHNYQEFSSSSIIQTICGGGEFRNNGESGKKKGKLRAVSKVKKKKIAQC